MPTLDPARITAKYLARTQAATSDYAFGVQNPRRDPKAAAIAAKGKWQNRVQEAIAKDRYAQGVARYDVAEAQRIASEDGGAAYAAGIAKRQEKIARVHARLMPKLSAISNQIQSMPQDTDAAREARMIANVRAVRAIKGTLTG